LLASTFTLGRAVVHYASPIFFIGIRMMFGGSLLLGFVYFFNKKNWKFLRKDIFFYFQLMFFHIYISYLGEFWALQYISSAKACLLYNLSPFVTALFSYYMFSEKLSGKKWFGLIIGLLGFLPILLAQVPQENIAGHFGSLSLPELALIISGCSTSYAWLLIKKMIQNGYSILMLNGIAMTSAGFLAFLTSLLVDGLPHVYCCAVPQDALSVSLTTILGTQEIGFLMFILYLVALILIANVICYNLYGLLLRQYSATFLSFAGFTTPLFAALWGFLLLGESIGTSFFVSLAITFIGLYLFYTEELTSRVEHS
jgi:drug/metabolite transporter (DMT)-like permease